MINLIIWNTYHIFNEWNNHFLFTCLVVKSHCSSKRSIGDTNKGTSKSSGVVGSGDTSIIFKYTIVSRAV